ncbi:hypothetical protein UlMin_008555 [Ulmus minor]
MIATYIYCKHKTYKLHEWAHMMIVVLILHLNYFAQYALCDTPAIGVGICISVAIIAPAISSLYLIISPLGKEYGMNNESLRPQWNRGILDFWIDISIAYHSWFCSLCVFGRNMERLFFGNMYQHELPPLAAVNIDNETVMEVLGLTGLVLCLFEVRSGNSNGILEDKFCRKEKDNRNEPLPHLCLMKLELLSLDPGTTTSLPSSSIISKAYYNPKRPFSIVKEDFGEKDKDETMTPPLIHREAI